jgi:branched-chain amino acid transport system substrate-binding protein
MRHRLKTHGVTGATAFHPLSTPLTYALTERVAQDQLSLLTVGIGRADAADGRVFPYIFPVPSTWWSQNTAKSRLLGQQAGGLAQLQGRKIAHVYHDTANSLRPFVAPASGRGSLSALGM